MASRKAGRPPSAPKQEYDLSLCVSLLSLFDFRGDKRVTRQDWTRGTRALTLHAMGEDDKLWELLLSKFDTRGTGSVDVSLVEDLVPIDPRTSLLLKAMFSSVTTLSDSMIKAQSKIDAGSELQKHRVVINMRKRLLAYPFEGWRDFVMHARSLRLKTVKRALQRDLLLGYNQWVDVATERKRLQRFMKRALKGGMTRAWFQWLDTLSDKERMGKFVKRVLNASLAKAWASWEDMISERKRMQRFMRRLLNLEALRAWDTWTALAVDSQRKGRLMHKYLDRILSAKLYAAWESWCADVYQRERLRSVLARALHAGLNRAFQSWLTTLDAVERMRVIARVALNASLNRAWNSWIDFLDEKAEQMSKLRAAANRLLHKQLVAALEEWKAVRADTRRMRRFGARLMNRGLARALTTWLESLQDQGRLSKFAKRVLNRSINSALRRWLDFLDETRRAKGTLFRVINASLTRAFNSWLAAAGERASLRTFAARMLNQQLSRAMVTWVAQVDEAQRMGDVLRRVINRAVAKAFDTWIDLCEERERQRARVEKVLLRMMNKEKAKAFDSWEDATGQMLRLKKMARRIVLVSRTKAFFTWLAYSDANRAATNKMRRVILRVMNRSKAFAFGRWSGEVADAKFKLQQIKKYVRRMLKLALVQGFTAWLELKETRRKMRLVTARFLHSEVARAYTQWRYVLMEVLKLKKFIRRMLSRQLLRCWNHWEGLSEKFRRLRAFGYRLKNRTVMATFNSWIEACENMLRLQKAAGRILKKSLGRAFNKWLDFAEHAGSAKDTIAETATNWTHAGLAKGLRSWKEMAATRKRQMEMLRSAVGRMVNRRLARVFDAWLSTIRKGKSTRDFLMKKAINLMRDRLLALPFYAWLELLEASGSAESTMLKAINLWKNRLLTQSFGAWEQVSGDARALRRKAVARFVKALQSKAFAAWAGETLSHRSNKEQLLGAVHMMGNQAVLLTFRAWRDYVRRKREVFAETLTRWLVADVARAFDTWRDQWAEGQRLLQLGHRVMKRYTDALLFRVFDHWCLLIMSEAARKEKLLQATLVDMTGRADMRLKMVLDAWHEWAKASGVRRKELAAKVYGRYHHPLLAKCFLVWHAAARTSAQQIRMMMLQVASVLSPDPSVLMTFAFELMRKHTADRKSEKEDKVRFAVVRMKHGILHVCFNAWLEILPNRKLEVEPVDAVVLALQHEVQNLKAHIVELSKQVATHERSKAYRYELSSMRDELHSFLFMAPVASVPPQPPSRQPPTVIDSQSPSSDEEEEVPVRRHTQRRPRSGGRSRPNSARAEMRSSAGFHTKPTPAEHEWPIRADRSVAAMGDVLQMNGGGADVIALSQTATGAAASAQLRARPPPGVPAADARSRPSPRASRMQLSSSSKASCGGGGADSSAAGSTADPPHFTCCSALPKSTYAAPPSFSAVPKGAVAYTAPSPRSANVSGASMSWAQKTHFSQLPPLL